MSYQSLSPQDLLGPLNEVEQKNSPKALYVAGDIGIVEEGARVSIVGSRKASPEGLRRASKLAALLASRGVIVVMALPRASTLRLTPQPLRTGRTIAVLGTPLDQVYPRQNAALQEEIMRDHLAVSQYAVGYPVQRKNFPLRNRTMALISDATVIIEAGNTSGSLSQGWEALRLGRPLFLAKSVTEDLVPQVARRDASLRGEGSLWITPSRSSSTPSRHGYQRSSMPTFPSKLSYAALLQYSPRGSQPTSVLSKT